MGPRFESEYLVLFQVTAMLLMPALLGLSIGRSLKIAPSRFSRIAIFNYIRAQRLFDAVWLGLAAVWFAYAALALVDLPTFSGEQSVTIAVAVLLIGTAVGHVWTHRVLAVELSYTWSSADDEHNTVIRIDNQGYFQFSHRDLDPAITPICAKRAIIISGSLSALALTVLGALALSLGAFTEITAFTSALLLVGLWLSLRVLMMDLAMDTWPGAATTQRLGRTTVYYVQVFEQWAIPAVLVGLMIVTVLGPIASVTDSAPATVSSFAIWGVLSMLFATAWNKLLYTKGRVPTALPFPMQVNRYSSIHPAWAYFVTILHLGMVLCLGLSIVAMNCLLP